MYEVFLEAYKVSSLPSKSLENLETKNPAGERREREREGGGGGG